MTQADSAWTPAVTADIDSISNKAFGELIMEFKEWANGQPPLPSEPPVENGWCDITPEIAENLLRRNKQNRHVSLTTVQKYARRMKAGVWRKTGQPGILSGGELYDMQHRLWAGYLGRVTFPSYMITDVPVQDDLFAYIDDNKPRNAADALVTAGGNGQSSIIAATVKLSWRYDHGALGVIKAPPIRTMDNIEVLNYSRLNPGLGVACHDVLTNFNKAVQVIGGRAPAKAVACFAGWKITALHGRNELEEFFEPLGSGANLAEDSPILALRNRLLKVGSDDKDDDMAQLHKLALVIKGFNMHVQGLKVNKKAGLTLADNEKFPKFEDVSTTTQQAEAAE